MVTHIAESPEPQNPSSPLMEETASSLSPRMEQVRRRVRNVGRVIRMKKVCEHCGMAFNKSHKYMQHLRTHRPLQQCDKCNFKTKDLKRFRNHQISHKKENPEVKCNICNELFATTTTRRIHKKKIHKVFECKYCCKDYKLEEEMINHMIENHGHIRDRPGYLTPREMKNVKPVNIFVDPPSPGGKSQFVCRLCNKETRNKYQLKIHIAQHLGVSSNKISDDFLITQDVEQFNRDSGSVSSFGSDDNTADGPKPGHSDYLYPQYMSVKREPGSALEDGFEHRGTSADTPSFVSMRSETSSISSITYNSDTSPAATMQDLFPLTTNRAEEIDIDDTPLLPRLWLKEEPESWSDSQNTLLNDSSGVRCGVCDIHFLDIEELHNHVLTSHNKLIYRCGQCEQIFPKAEDLFKHTLTEHGKAACSAKPENLVKPSQLEINEVHTVLPENQHTLPTFYCEICRESFKSAKRLRNHEKAKHRKIFTCQACNVTHYQSAKMIRHQKLCHKDMFRCRYFCMALFETEAERSVHHLKVHNKDDTKVTCPYCKVEYQYEGNLINHLDKCKNCPPDKRPAHVCGNCNIMFPSIEHYNVHIKNCRPCKKDSEKTKAQNEDKRKHKEAVCGTSSKEDLIDVEPSQDAVPRNDAIPEAAVNRTKEGNVSVTGDVLLTDPLSVADVPRGERRISAKKQLIPLARHNSKELTEGKFEKVGQPCTKKARNSDLVHDVPHKCIYCPHIYENQTVAIDHILACHKHLLTRMIKEPQICEICGSVFKNQLCFCKHISKHYSDLEMWEDLVPHNILEIVKCRSFCWICKSNLRGKLKNHTNMRNNNIDKIFSIKNHEKVEQPFHCSKCGDKFATRARFWKHLKRHLVVLPKTLKHSESVPASSKKGTKKGLDKSLECSECSLRFHDNAEFYNHLALHFIRAYDANKSTSGESSSESDECEAESDRNGSGEESDTYES